jgi:cation:H+ antiporter
LFSQLYFGDALSTWALLVELLIAGMVVVFAGSRLTRLADRLAEEYGLGRALVGVLLLATVTSLPEVVTCVTSVVIGATDMAYATLMGSCSFNITLIIVFNAALRAGSILRNAKPTHTLTASFGIVMIGVAMCGVLLTAKYEELHPHLAQASELGMAATLAICFLVGLNVCRRMEQAPGAGAAPAEAVNKSPGLLPKITLLSAILVLAAWWMARTGDVLAEHPIEMIGRPLGATFVGACFLAIASSLPEIVTGLAAVRLGSLDMALGNIFGSNMFNVFVIVLLKLVSLASGDRYLLAGKDFDFASGLFSGLLPILLTGITLIGLNYPFGKRFLGFGVDSILIGILYFSGMIMLLAHP